jgi:hypothetical protein
MGSWSLLTSNLIWLVGNVRSRLPPYSYFAEGRRDSQLGNAAGDFIPRGLPPFTFFVKGGRGRRPTALWPARVSWLGVQPSPALLRTIGNPGWLARSVAICFWQCSKKSAGVMASWA